MYLQWSHITFVIAHWYDANYVIMIQVHNAINLILTRASIR